MKKEITIDGSVIDTMDQFYDEVEKKLTSDLTWYPGRTLDAFNDLLREGFLGCIRIMNRLLSVGFSQREVVKRWVN